MRSILCTSPQKWRPSPRLAACEGFRDTESPQPYQKSHKMQVGGLGDVVTGLARACLQQGHHVTVLLPFYESLPKQQLQDLHLVHEFDCPKAYFDAGIFVI